MPHDMVNLKRTSEDKKAEEEKFMGGPGDEEYSYGLRIDLHQPELEKLGVSTLAVGDERLMTAVVRVSSFRENSNEQGTDRSAELLITSMSLSPKLTEDDPIGAMYGGDK